MIENNVIDLADRRGPAPKPAGPDLWSDRVRGLAIQGAHLPTTLSRSEIQILCRAILTHANKLRV